MRDGVKAPYRVARADPLLEMACAADTDDEGTGLPPVLDGASSLGKAREGMGTVMLPRS